MKRELLAIALTLVLAGCGDDLRFSQASPTPTPIPTMTPTPLGPTITASISCATTDGSVDLAYLVNTYSDSSKSGHAVASNPALDSGTIEPFDGTGSVQVKYMGTTYTFTASGSTVTVSAPPSFSYQFQASDCH
jgi:hypothetical protein